MAVLTLVPFDEAPLSESVRGLQKRIEKSSNFRFAWQFYRTPHGKVASVGHARRLLEILIASPECHAFLRVSFDDMYEPSFTISPFHEHAEVVDAKQEFPNVMAAAAGDHLGAYSSDSRDPTPGEASRVTAMFESVGPYRAFQLVPGHHPGCKQCSNHDNHLFSSWFYGVAWDWCFVVGWPEKQLAWVGCLTDTD